MTIVEPRDHLVDVLLPNRIDVTLDALGASTFCDDGVDVPVSPVDQLLVALVRRLLTDSALGGVAVLQLPRARHRCALVLAICAHLMRLREPGILAGPVVLAALDVDLSTQLRALTVRNYGQVSLGRGNPLGAQRLTRSGALEPLLGPAASPDNSLVYFNTRVGAPHLQCSSPLVVIDATSITSPDARSRTMVWAADHHAAATVIVGDLGDDSMVQAVADAGLAPLVFAITEAESAMLVENFGRQEASASALSSTWVLWRDQVPAVTVKGVGDEELNGAISTAFSCLAARPSGPMPAELDYPTKLLHNGIRLAARIADYRQACALADRPGEGPNPLRRRLQRITFRPQGQWRGWGTARWGSLKTAVETLWRFLDQANPKLDALWEALDNADRSGTGRILVRCHSRAAQTATRMSLSSGLRSGAQEELWKRVANRVEITTFSARYPAGYADLQILTGTPPPWLFSVLVGAEAGRTDLLAYNVEAALLRRHAERWRTGLDGWRATAFRVLGASDPTPTASLVADGPGSMPAMLPVVLRLPGLSLVEILDRATEAVDAPQLDSIPGSRNGTGTTNSCVPVALHDGRIWWVPNESDRDGDLATPILADTASGHRRIPLRELRPGDRVVVPAGDGTDSVHARLVAAMHGNNDVASLEAILGQFRAAARAVLASYDTNRAAIDAVRDAGARAPDQLPYWARGTTIAPNEPGDVAAVFKAARSPTPDLGLLYGVAGTLRNLHRALGRFVAAAASGRGEDAVARLRDIIGEAADELLDEFVVATVVEIGGACTVPASLVGSIHHLR